jgi:hypothetical protein
VKNAKGELIKQVWPLMFTGFQLLAKLKGLRHRAGRV